MTTEPETRGVKTAAVLFTACAAGWFVMELEVLGTRVLTPYFGSAIFVVMGSVIGVFLLSMAVGYILGGRLSRVRRSGLAAGVCLIGAGGWLFLVPFITDPVCEAVLRLPLDEKWGSLLAALALFSLPTMLLATISPTAVRWLTVRAEESGQKAGMVFCVSTVASFAGCVTTAFYLVLLSVRQTLWVSGAVVLALGVTVCIVSLRRERL
jgi:hypothetical protein